MKVTSKCLFYFFKCFACFALVYSSSNRSHLAVTEKVHLTNVLKHTKITALHAKRHGNVWIGNQALRVMRDYF